MAAKKSSKMTKEHKAALAEGRRNARAVKNYLEALRDTRPKRGRKRTPESVQRQLDQVEADLGDADPISELQLVQRRRDLEAALASFDQKLDIAGLEKEFVKHARSYAKNKGISYAAFREVGVEPDVLKRAGIKRST